MIRPLNTAIVAAVAIALAGCGDEKPVKTTEPEVQESPQAPAGSAGFTELLDCLQREGIDVPELGSGQQSQTDPNDPAFKAAMEKCKQYRPSNLPGQDEDPRS